MASRDSDGFAFRPLEHELGFHDLLSPVVNSRGIDDPVVSRHESLHEELIARTPFGWLQRNLALIARDLKPQSKSKDLLQSWVNLSIDKSRRAHESYATYLTIKWFPQDAEPALVARHPSDYRDYFDLLALPVDKHFETSDLQFLVGKALVNAAFAGDLVQKIASISDLTPAQLPDEQSPNFRLDRILEALDDAYLTGIRKAITEATSVQIESGNLESGFRLDMESHWRALPETTLQMLNFGILAKLYEVVWNITESELNLPLMNRSGIWQPEPHLQSLFEELIESKELAIEAKFQNTPADLTLDGEFHILRRGLGQVEIHNEAAVASAPQLESDKPFSQCFSNRNIAITKRFYSAREEIAWRLISFEGQQARLNDLDDDFIIRALNIDRPYRISQGEQNVLDTVVVGVSSFANFIDVYDRYSDVVIHADHVARFMTTFWYMGGNFVEWIDSPLFMEEAYCCQIELVPIDSDDEHIPQENADKPHTFAPVLSLFRSPIAHGYFVRLLPGYEHRMIAQNDYYARFNAFVEAERSYFSHVIEKLISAMYCTWQRF